MAYSIPGVLIVMLWIVQWDYRAIGLPDFQEGIEVFILSGFMLVLGSVWVVMFNSAPLVRVVTSLLGRGTVLAPIMRTSMAYPMASRFRTGMTLAMFSLIVFTLMVLSTIIAAFGTVTEDTRQFSGGFDVSVRVNPTNPINDFEVALRSVNGVDAIEIEAVGSQSGLPVQLQQVGYENEDLSNGFIVSVDEGYTDTITYGFSLIHSSYPDASSVWGALQNEPGTAVVSSFIVPARSGFDGGGNPNEFRLQGFFRDDAVMPEVFVEAYDRAQQTMVKLRVIAVVEESGLFDGEQSLIGPIMTSYSTASQIQELPFFGYFLRLNDPSRATDVAIALEDAFIDNGLQAESLEEAVRSGFSIQLGFNRLIRGFMSLGLIVGVAALGVIAARSVVERRSLIGMLRAIGYQRNMVQMSFLIESSFISLLGIAIGMTLALGLSVGIVNEIGKEIDGLRNQVPWESGLLVFALAYGASLLTTFLPARQAAGIYPAEALRLAE
jgi:putative ABC transport system permease protein